MVKEIPYNFGDTGINGEVLGRQNVYSLPLGNSVLTSDPLTITINKTPNSASSRYFLSYENPELGPITDNNSINRNEIVQLSVNDTLFGIGSISSTPLIINTSNTSSLSKIYFLPYENPELGSNADKTGVYRNEILQLSVNDTLFSSGIVSSIPLIISTVNTSSLFKTYFLSYDNPELGSNTDKTGVYRNEILQINNQRQYRYLIQDGTGSNYPVDTTYDLNYNSTKVISNFDNLSNLAPINLPISSSGSFGITGGPNPNTSSYITNSMEFITIGAGGGSGGPDGGSYACGGGSGALISGSVSLIFSGSILYIYVGGGGGGGVGCVAGTGAGAGGTNGGGAGGNAGGSGCSGGGGGGGGWSGISTGSNYIAVVGGGSGGGGANEGGANDANSAGGGVQNAGANGTSFTGGTGDNFSGDGGGWAGGGGGYYGGAKQNTSTYVNSGGGNYTASMTFNCSILNGTGVGQGSTAANITYNWNGLTGNYGGGGAPIIGSGGTAGSGTTGVVAIRYAGIQKATGGTVSNSGGSTIHTFTSNATMSFYDAPFILPGVVGGYGYFDGSGSYLRISGSSLLNLGSGSASPFTVEYDFYTNSSSKYQTILSRGAGSINYNTSSGLVYNAGISSSKIIWEYYTNNTSSYLLTGSTNIIDNNWYSYAVTYDGNITRLYLNGTLENSVSNSIYNYPSTLLPSLTSSFIGRLVNTSSNDFSGYLDKIRITTGIARYTNASYITQSSSYPTSTGFLAGSNYCNSNILNIRFANDYLTGSNLILPSGTNDFTSSQDILVTNITGTVNNNTINTISSGSNNIKRNDGITDKTIYTGDNYISDTTIFTRGNVERITVESSQVIFNSLSDPSKNYSYKGTGSNIIIRNDGITDKTVYTGDNYVSDATIFTRGNVERTTIESSQVIFNSLSDPSKNYSYKGSGSNIIKRNDGISDKTIYTGDNYVSSATINAIGTIDKTILNGSSVVINTDTNNFIPSINKTFTYEVDYNAVFNQEIDSVLTIVTTYSLPLGFSISSDAKRIIGYVNFSDTKTIKLELSDSSTYNIVLKPIFFKKKYTY
jgi:hypothetical protein